jgi:hypothetical protein
MYGLVLLAQLLHPAEVLEHWTFLPTTAPLRETVSARGRYVLAAAPTASPGSAPSTVRLRLPDAVQGYARPDAVALATGDTLSVTRGPDGWEARWLRRPDMDAVRIEATVTRHATVTRGRPFAVAWPRLAPARVPTRRVVWADRAWLEQGPSPVGWTCPNEPGTEVPCVSREAAPGPVVTRIDPVPSPRGSGVLAGLVCALAAWWVSRPAPNRAERMLSAAGGATVGAAVALALVGAGWMGWALGLGVAVSTGTVAGVGALASRATRAVGVGALVAVPLMAVMGAGPWATTVVALVAGVVVLAGAARAAGAVVV